VNLGPTDTSSSAAPGRPRVTILVNNPYVADARAWKLASSLGRAGLDVTVVAREGEGLPAHEDRGDHRVRRIAQPRPLPWLPAPGLPADAPERTGPAGRLAGRLRETAGRGAQALRYLALSRAWAGLLERELEPADVWQAENVITLPLAVALGRRRGGVIVYDANDLDTEAGRMARLPGLWRTLLRRHERRLVREVDALVTVSEPYAEVLERTLGRPVDAIVRNGPLLGDEPPAPDRRYHERLVLPADRRVVLYLGQLMGGRGLEQLFEAIALVEGADLVVAGFGPDRERYEALARSLPHADRIHLLGPVAPEEIAAWTAAADVAAMPVQPDTLNHRLNTPTKLYDAMGVGVPVVASDLPGIAPIVRETGCGVLCDPTDARDVARAIREVIDAPPEARAAMRERCLAAARDRYAWQHQVRALLDVYARLGVPVDSVGWTA
jgi:glycosyltransferase involved in cell wall biosynthesis